MSITSYSQILLKVLLNILKQINKNSHGMIFSVMIYSQISFDKHNGTLVVFGNIQVIFFLS
jgi:hypothetical protein